MSGWNRSVDRNETAVGQKKHLFVKFSIRSILALIVIACVLIIIVCLFVSKNRCVLKEREVESEQVTSDMKSVSSNKVGGKDISDRVIGTNVAEVLRSNGMSPKEIEAEERAKDPLYDRHHIVAKSPLLGNPTEQLMLSVFTTELGDMPPMLPSIPEVDEQQIKKTIGMLTDEKDSDSHELREAKKLVNDVKVELKKFLEDGGTVNGFLAYYVNQLDLAFHERNTCKELFGKSLRHDSPEVAIEIFRKYNERLKTKGIKPISLTTKQKEYLGIEE